MSNILLVDYKSGNYRPSLGLARFSTLHKEMGDNVIHASISNSDYTLPKDFIPDKVYVSIVFSWSVTKLSAFVIKLKSKFPHLQEDGRMLIGGISTAFMDETICQMFGVRSVDKGCSVEIDNVIPDFSIFEENKTYVFTMRQCPNKCSFCAVNVIEPERWYISNWKEQIDMSKKIVVIGDNNAFAADYDHRKDLFEYLTQIAHKNGVRVDGSRKIRCVEFDGGFDWRYMTEENMEFIKNIKWNKIRFAWDNVNYEKRFDESMKTLLNYYPKTSSRGVHENMECYVLYNFYKNENGIENYDTLEDALYRMYKLFYHYKVYPYLMRYQPLNTMKYKSYVSPKWSKQDCIDIGRFANNRYVLWTAKYFRHYYGRLSDGTSLSSTKGLRDIMKYVASMYNQPLELNYDKTFNDNLHLLKEDIKIRTEGLNKLQYLIDEEKHKINQIKLQEFFSFAETFNLPILNLRGGINYGN